MERNEKGQFIKGAGLKDLTGKRFGKLTVIGLDRISNNRTYWIVKCDCGNVKSVRGDTLKVITSCGCVKKKQDKKNLHITNNHNHAKHPVYITWCGMMNRCYSSKNTFYSDYGGRGIKVCDEWHDVGKFCRWAEDSGFEEGLTIERIDVNGNYEPSNCKWITQLEQAWNKRNTFYCKIDGESIPVAKLAHDYNIPLKTLKSRYKQGIRDKNKLLYKGNLKHYKE